LALVLIVAPRVLALARPALALSDPADFPPPGRMIAVDGHQLHLQRTGAGAPTVTLEEGAGGASLNWAWIERARAKTIRVCSYNYPGGISPRAMREL
jgi:hypothetical protein